jgi:sugar O-acyltransferase (sialic acid O-acetyltransferase NeuD family)
VKFVIIGAGQMGRLVAEVSTRIAGLECVGFLDGNPAVHGRSFYDIPVVGGEDKLEEYAGTDVVGALPVFGDLTARLKLFRRVKAMGFKLPNVIDPSVRSASDLKLGEGIFISLGTNILTNVEIHDFAIIGTGVNILHDTTIGSNCVMGGGTTVGATVSVGRNVSFGVGVQVASGSKRIGDDVQIAAGSVILKDVPDNAFVLGNPARVIGHNPSVEA